MAKLLDEIRKAVKAKAKLQEAEFKGDDGYSLVPDVEFVSKGVKKEAADDDEDDEKKVDVKEADMDDKDDKKADGDKKDMKEALKRALRARLAEDEDKKDDDKDKDDKKPDFLKKEDAADGDPDKDDDDKEPVKEDQENRDQNNVGALNAKLKTGVDKYSDNADHVDDLAKDDIDDVIGEDKDDDMDDDDKKDMKEAEDSDKDADDDEDKMKSEARIGAGDINVAEDLKAIFGGQKLSESFKKRVAGIYEAAVVSKVNEVLADIVEALADDYRSEKKKLAESMVDKIDAYLDKVVSEWVDANKPAVESKLRVEMSESFMEGLKTLFEDHYIEVPKGKENVLDSLIKENTTVNTKLNKEINENVKLRKQVEGLKKQALLKEAAAGLSANQVEKLKLLSEAVEYDNDKQYTEKLSELKEAYFAAKRNVRTVEDDEDPIELNEGKTDQRSDEVKAVSEVMGRFLRK